MNLDKKGNVCMENASAATCEMTLVKCQGKGSIFDFFQVIQIFKWGSSFQFFLLLCYPWERQHRISDRWTRKSQEKSCWTFFFFVRMMTFTESISQVLGVWVGDISYKTSLLHVFNSEMFIFFHSYSLCVFSPHYFLFLSMAWSVAGYLFTCKLW